MKQIDIFSLFRILGILFSFYFFSCSHHEDDFVINRANDYEHVIEKYGDNINYFYNKEKQNDDWYIIDFNLRSSGEEYFFEFDNSQTDEVKVYNFQNGIPVLILNAGDAIPFNDRKVKHRNIIFPIDSLQTLAVNIKNRGSYLIPCRLKQEAEFLAFDSLRSFWIGLAMGVIFLFIVLGFGALVKSGFNKMILYFWLFTVFAFLFFFAEFGFADMYIWPKNPRWEEPGIFIFILSSMASLLFLLFKIFRLQEAADHLLLVQRFLLLFVVILGGVILSGAIKNDSVFSLFYDGILILVVLVFLYTIYAGITAIQREIPYAVYFLTGLSIMIIGSMIKPLSLLGLVTLDYFVQYGGLVGQMINIIAIAVLFILFYFRRLQYSTNLETQIHELERSALQAQMNPHFIFNCLNSIQNYIAKNEQVTAMDYLAKFALLIRKTLNASSNKLISLEEEIGMLRGYLEMEKLRLKDKFIYELHVENELLPSTLNLAPLLIQPFIENAVIHGMKGIEKQGLIDIRFALIKNKLSVTITDNGKGYQQKVENNHKSYAMQITRERLRHINNSKGDIDVKVIDLGDQNGATGTRIELIITISRNTVF